MSQSQNYHGTLKQSRMRSSDRKLTKYFRSEDSTSSDDDSSFNRRGQSLDRNLYKQQKKMLCFQREKDSSQNRRPTKSYNRSKENLSLKSPASGGDYTFQEHRLVDPKRQSYSGDRYKHSTSTLPLGDRKYSSLHRGEAQSFEALDRPSKIKEISKFQIGKRFLKGEIGIKSFNYYLLKESLKSTKKSGSKVTPTPGISKSEENIYEEVFFTERRPPRRNIRNQISYADCELCIQECKNKNCAICQANEQKCLTVTTYANPKAKTPSNETRTFIQTRKMNASNSIENITTLNAIAPNVLQYHSYNPNNPGVYKIETTPVAFTSDYNPIEEIYGIQQYAGAHKTITQKVSSSSSDSVQQQKYMKSKLRNNCYDRTNELLHANQSSVQHLKPQIYKTDSKASILSEMSIKSENSTNRYYRPAEMSDSSMGDSLFSYPSQRRYYGSAESCRFSYECRRCSLDGEKCSYSDNCRYECRNCDCSSSYFSSDFDDGNFSRKNSARISTNSRISCYDDVHAIDSKTSRYAEDFMKHMNNVKKTCNYQTMGGNGTNSMTPQTERAQKTKSSVNELVKDVVRQQSSAQQQYQMVDENSIASSSTTTTTATMATIKQTKPQRTNDGYNEVNIDKAIEDQQSKRLTSAKSNNIIQTSATKSESYGNGKNALTKMSIGKNGERELSDANETAEKLTTATTTSATPAATTLINATEYCIEDCECCQNVAMKKPTKMQSIGEQSHRRSDIATGDGKMVEVFQCDNRQNVSTIFLLFIILILLFSFLNRWKNGKAIMKNETEFEMKIEMRDELKWNMHESIAIWKRFDVQLIDDGSFIINCFLCILFVSRYRRRQRHKLMLWF